MDAPRIAIWTEHGAIRASQVDASRCLRPASLCHLLQDAAGHHAISLGLGFDHMAAAGQVWVLSRLRVAVRRPLRWQEPYALSTWARSWKAPLSFRDFELCDGSGARCAEASSLWVALEQDSRRPAREIRAAQAPPLAGRSPSLEVPARLEAPGNISAERVFPILPSDIDMLGHVNNAVYLRWMLDSLGVSSAQVSGFELHFLGETLPGGDICLATEEEAPGIFRFSLSQEASEKCRGRVECPGLGR